MSCKEEEAELLCLLPWRMRTEPERGELRGQRRGQVISVNDTMYQDAPGQM